MQKNAIFLHISTVLIIFSYLDSGASYLMNLHVSRKRSFHHTKCQISSTFKDLRKCQSRIDLQKSSSSSSSFSSFSSSSVQISVHFHDYRVRYELNVSTNESSKSRTSSINESRKSNELIASKRNWERTRNNVTSVHCIQHLTELIFLFYHIEWQSRFSLMIKFSTYALSSFHVFASHFDILV